MQPHFIQILMLIVGFFILNQYRYGLRYYCLLCLPLYATTLFKVSFGSTYITSFQVLLLALVGWVLTNGQPLNKTAMIKGGIILSPFLIALLYNYFFFTPIVIWDINSLASNRYSHREGLNLTNITQLIYVIFGVISYIIFASLRLEKHKLKNIIELSMWCVIVAGVFQVLAFYLGFNPIFKAIFSNIDNRMADQVFGLWGMKRVSSTFSESSYFGLYAFYTLTFYLYKFGYQEFIRSRATLAIIFMLLISTSTSAYLGLIILLGILYWWYSNPEEKMYYYIIMLLAAPIAIYVMGDTVTEYWSVKEGSNNIRMNVSWYMAKEDILKSPIFGYAFGTSKPLFIHTQMVHSIGFFGVIIFLFGLLAGNGNYKYANLYLLGIAVLGTANFELARTELWVYFGLLTNPYITQSTKTIKANGAIPSRPDFLPKQNV